MTIVGSSQASNLLNTGDHLTLLVSLLDMRNVDSQPFDKISKLGLGWAVLIQIRPHQPFKRALVVEGRVFDLNVDNNPACGCTHTEKKTLEAPLDQRQDLSSRK